ncbi:MAG: hypothetical protein NTX97_13665 [Bacteroidetes bacterium]|nr:hypothetical protein [Bacteroidota bacterium]
MCFSTEASFGASAILSLAGVAAIKNIQTRSQLAFACIPLIFAFQQFCEGFVWLSFTNNKYFSIHQLSINSFIVIAQVLWPFWVPYTIILMEKSKKQKKKLYTILVFGSLLSFYHLVCLFLFDVTAEVKAYHIYYELNFPHIGREIEGILYIIPTIIPPFLSSIKGMKLFGILIFSSFLITAMLYNEYAISVWCFFAGIISVIVYLIITQPVFLKQSDIQLHFKKDLSNS